jgi:hypothetical protein
VSRAQDGAPKSPVHGAGMARSRETPRFQRGRLGGPVADDLEHEPEGAMSRSPQKVSQLSRPVELALPRG